MSIAIDRLKGFLSASPSVIFPQDAFEYIPAIEAENAKLRELANGYEALTATLCNERGCDGCPFDDPEQIVCEHMRLQTSLRELGIEVTA